MNSSTSELKATQCEQEHAGSDIPSSEECSSKRDSDVHTGSAGTPVWVPPSNASIPLIPPHPQQHTIQPGMMDPFSLRFQCPCPSTQCQMTYPDYLLDQASQYHFLPSPMPGPAESSHHGSFSAPWFEPILCSMMPGDLHSPLFSVCPPQAMDHQQVHDGLTEVTSRIMQPVVCNMSGSGQVGPVNHCEPGPVFLSLESAPTHREDGPAQVKESLYRHTKTACSLYEVGNQAVNMQPPAPPARAVGTSSESKSRKPCHCTRSQCLKLYCDCFANGVMCNNCDCSNCHNNAEHETKRHKAIKSCLGRNPDAFRPKIAGGRSGVVKGWHNKGCNCKRSNCLKNYCECYEANIMCTSSCKCVGCRNYYDSSEMCLKAKSVKDKWPVSVITHAVVDAVCGCLLAQAEEAEREDQSPAQAEHMVLEEFGHCITQIVKAMFKPIETLQ